MVAELFESIEKRLAKIKPIVLDKFYDTKDIVKCHEIFGDIKRDIAMIDFKMQEHYWDLQNGFIDEDVKP